MSSADDRASPWLLWPATRSNAGGGHVSRCAALGGAIVPGGSVVAVIEPGGERWIERFRKLGVGTVPQAELAGGRWGGIVLDDYSLRAGDIARCRSLTSGPVVQIVDHDAPLPGIDLAINATPGLAGDSLGPVPALLGGSYAMLAKPYCGRPKPVIATRVGRVVVGIGLIDVLGVTERVLAALRLVAGPDLRVDVMLGSESPNIGRVAAIVEANSRWHLHRDAAEPWKLLEGADIAISGSGQSLLERLAFGLPTLAMAVVDNQEPALAGVTSAGAAYRLSPAERLSEAEIASAFSLLTGDASLRSKISEAAQRLIDGHGAARVARHLAVLSSAADRRAGIELTGFTARRGMP